MPTADQVLLLLNATLNLATIIVARMVLTRVVEQLNTLRRMQQDLNTEAREVRAASDEKPST